MYVRFVDYSSYFAHVRTFFKMFLDWCIYFVTKNSAIDSKKTSLTQEWLVEESAQLLVESIDWCTKYLLISIT